MRIPVIVALLLLCSGAAAQSREPVVGLPCDGCEAVFVGMPTTLSSRARIAPADEPGQPMTVTGRVYGGDGRPRAGVIVYAYQTNARGTYPPPLRLRGFRHGRLRGWAVSDANGRYTFDTIRPGSYPSRDVPEHIHMQVIEPRCATYHIDDIVLTDDPLLTAEQRRHHSHNRAGSGIATPTRRDGRWQVTRDIRLGLNIPGYPACDGGRVAG